MSKGFTKRLIFVLIFAAVWFSISYTLFSILGSVRPFDNWAFIATTVAPVTAITILFPILGP